MKEFTSMTTKICGWCSDGKELHKNICGEEKRFYVGIIQCTREKGHSGKHIFCGLDVQCIHTWNKKEILIK